MAAWFVAVAMLTWAIGSASGQSQNAFAATLEQHQSRHYDIRTNLPTREIADYARHMDAVFVAYDQRFSDFRPQRAERMPLYLLDTQDDYRKLLEGYGLSAANSAGLFFVNPRGQGLVTYVRGRSRRDVHAILQHEGFHQFAWKYIGHELPIWANEGIAQYFEDGIIVRGRLVLGRRDPTRLALIQHTVTQNNEVPFNDLLVISSEEWSQVLATAPERAAVLYAQSWSVVDMLVNSGQTRWRNAFEEYLQLISRNVESREAYQRAFKTDSTREFELRWRQYVAQVQPDSLTEALERMEFLAHGLLSLREQNQAAPRTAADLQHRLRRMGFQLVRSHHGITRRIDAQSTDVYQFTNQRGAKASLVLLEPVAASLPPRITAPGLSPEPTLVWYQQRDGSLIFDFEFR